MSKHSKPALLLKAASLSLSNLSNETRTAKHQKAIYLQPRQFVSQFTALPLHALRGNGERLVGGHTFHLTAVLVKSRKTNDIPT